jgi:hypothetical protein
MGGVIDLRREPRDARRMQAVKAPRDGWVRR